MFSGTLTSLKRCRSCRTLGQTESILMKKSRVAYAETPAGTGVDRIDYNDKGDLPEFAMPADKNNFPTLAPVHLEDHDR